MVVVKVRLLAVRPSRSSRKRSPSTAAVLPQGKRERSLHSCWRFMAGYHAIGPWRCSGAALPTLPAVTAPNTPSSSVSATRWLAVGSLVGLIVLGLAWELWLAPLAPGRLLAGAQGAAAGGPACRPAQEPDVHLPLGQPDGLALFHRRRGARLERHQRHEPGACACSKWCCAWRSSPPAPGTFVFACATRHGPATGRSRALNASLLIDKLRAIVGAAHVLTEGDLSAWEQDWRKRSRGKALAVVRPGQHAAGGRGGQGLRGGRHGDRAAGRQHRTCGRLDPRRERHPGAAEPAAHERGSRHRRCQPHDDGRGRLRAADPAGGRREGRLPVPAEPGGRRQLHHRRQPGDQRRRHAGAALRQCARAVPGPGSRHAAGRRSGTAPAACARTTPATTCAT